MSPTRQIIQILLPSAIAGIATFIYVEAIAYKYDKSNMLGFVWGAILSVLVATIVAIGLLIVRVHSL